MQVIDGFLVSVAVCQALYEVVGTKLADAMAGLAQLTLRDGQDNTEVVGIIKALN